MVTMNKYLSIENAKSGTDKIGLVVEEGTKFILPLFYLDAKKTTLTDILDSEKNKLKLIVKAWRKYQKSTENFVSSKGNDQSGYYNFDVAMSIVEDYVNNGIYLEYEKNSVLRRDGRVDFSKTIKKCKPLLTEQGSVYLEYITHIKKINDEEIIRNIQTIALNAISKEIGWLIGFSIRLPIEHGSHSINKRSVYALHEAKQTSFNTRKLVLIDLLLKYIKNTNKENSTLASNIFVGTAYSFWEEMVSKVFGNLSKREVNKLFYVRHAYKLKSTDKVTRVMDPLMPDAIFMNADNICVVDAKYYSQNNLPSNEDITKQFIYNAKAVKKYGDKFNYNNWFIIPTDQPTNVSDIEVIFDTQVSPTLDFAPIRILYANIEEVVYKYVSSDTMHSVII